MCSFVVYNPEFACRWAIPYVAAKSTSALFGEVKRKKRGFSYMCTYICTIHTQMRVGWDWQQSKVGSGTYIWAAGSLRLGSRGNWAPVVWVLGLDAPPMCLCLCVGRGGERGYNHPSRTKPLFAMSRMQPSFFQCWAVLILGCVRVTLL